VTTRKSFDKIIEFIFPGLIALVIAIVLLYSQKYFASSILVLFIFFALASWLISRFSLQYYFLLVLAFILPLSVEVPISDQMKINIPGEPMLAIAILIMGFEVLKKRPLFHDLFFGESKWTIPILSVFVISTLFSTMTMVSLKFSAINLGYILVFFLWQKLLFKERPDFFPKLLILFSLSQLFVLAFSIYQFSGYNWNPVTTKGIFRPFYKDHTIFGAAEAILASFWLLYPIRLRSSKLKLIFLVLGIIFLAGVFLSSSRAAFLSVLFFVFVWVALQLRLRIRHIALMFLLGFLIIVLYQNHLIRFLYSNKYVSHDYNSSYVERIESSGNISTDISNLERLNRWYSGIKMAVEKPYTGFGPGTYQFKYIPYQNPKLMNRLTVKNYWHIPENSGGTAHSEYILALSEMGIFGLASLLLLIGRWFWIAFEKNSIDPQRKNILIAFAVISTYLFHGAFNNFLNTDKFAFLFWGFAAWLAANHELSTNSIPESLASGVKTTQSDEL
jgi:hypothetical protein